MVERICKRGIAFLLLFGFGWLVPVIQAQAAADSSYCRLQTGLESGVDLALSKQYQAADTLLRSHLPDFEGKKGLDYERLLGEYHFWMGYLGYYMGDPITAKAELTTADSVIFAIDGFGSELRARIRRLQGMVAYFMDGNALKSQKLYENAFQEWQQVTAKDTAEYAIVLQCMGQAAGRLGEYDKSIDLYSQTLAIREEFYGPSHWRVAWTYWYTGNTHFYAQKFELAKTNYENALQILKVATPNDYKVIGKITGNLAVCYYWLGHYDIAIERCHEAIQGFTSQNAPYAEELIAILPNLAMALAKQQRFPESLKAIANAYQVAHKNNITTGPLMARITSIHASIYMEMEGPSTRSLQMIQRAIWNIAPNTDTIDLNSYPKSVLETEDPLHLQLFSILKADLMFARARNSELPLHSYEASLQGYELAAALSDRLRLKYDDPDDKITLSNRGTKYLGEALSCAYALWEITKDPHYIDRAFRLMESSKFQLLLELFQKSQLHVAGEFEGTALQELDSLRRRCNELDYLLSLNATTSDSLGRYRAELLEKRIALRQLEDSLQTTSLLFKNLNRTERLASLDSIVNYAHNPKLAVVTYTVTDSAAFVIMSTEGKSTFRRTVLPPNINDSIHAWSDICRSMVTDPQQIRTFSRLGYLLQELLLGPELRQLKPNVTELLIIPDGTLSSLPFEALLTKPVPAASTNYGKLPYLIRKYQIHYGASASLWLAQRGIRRENAMECFGIAWGNVLRDSIPGIQGTLKPLNGSHNEVQGIESMIQGRYLYAKDATEAAFKQFAPQFGLLHLALHARADADPEILFPVGASQGEDGILHFHELFQMRLKARLAVLSACETGVGEMRQGEGIQSISSGFAAAGIPTLLVSLWELDDRSGMMLMKSFYQGLGDGMGVDQALRKAKLDYLENAVGYEASPYYWSTMVPLGNMEPIALQPANGDYRRSLFAGITLCLCISILYRIYKKKRLSK